MARAQGCACLASQQRACRRLRTAFSASRGASSLYPRGTVARTTRSRVPSRCKTWIPTTGPGGDGSGCCALGALLVESLGMGLLTFGLNVTLDGCIDHTQAIADDELLDY